MQGIDPRRDLVQPVRIGLQSVRVATERMNAFLHAHQGIAQRLDDRLQGAIEAHRVFQRANGAPKLLVRGSFLVLQDR